jgi:hypothetical protein
MMQIVTSEFKAARFSSMRNSASGAHFRLYGTTDYATVELPLPGISNDLEAVRLL